MLKKSLFISVCFMSVFSLTGFFSKKHCELSEELLQPHSIKILSYKTTKKERGKILILPPTGGVSYLEKKYAQDLCEKAFSSFIISSWDGINEEAEDLNIHNTLLSRAQKAIRQVLSAKTTDKDFVGIFGTSVGGIHAATALGHFDSLKAGFFIVAGAPVHKVIAYSTEKTLSKYRTIRMKKFGFSSQSDYAEALNKKISPEVQPLYKTNTEKKSFVVVAMKDTTVPSRFQKKMAQALKAQTLKLRGGHLSSILWFRWFHSKKVISFFETASQKN